MPKVSVTGKKAPSSSKVKAQNKGASRPTKSSKSKESTAVSVPGMSADKMAQYQAMYDQKQKEEEERSSNLYDISRNIHRNTKYVKQTNGGEGQVRSKIHFLDALKKVREKKYIFTITNSHSIIVL